MLKSCFNEPQSVSGELSGVTLLCQLDSFRDLAASVSTQLNLFFLLQCWVNRLQLFGICIHSVTSSMREESSVRCTWDGALIETIGFCVRWHLCWHQWMNVALYVAGPGAGPFTLELLYITVPDTVPPAPSPSLLCVHLVLRSANVIQIWWEKEKGK